MPTTFIGLLIFVVLLAPGFLFILVIERGPFTRSSPSVLRESASVALASIVCDIAAVIAYLAVATLMAPGRLPSIRRLLTDGAVYWRADAIALLVSLVATLATACFFAVLLGGVVNRTDGFAALESRWPLRWVFPAGGARTESAWWRVLRREHPDRVRRVTCFLEDGSQVRGWLNAFNPTVDETGDREIVLAAPIRIRPAEGHTTSLETGYVALSARYLRFIHVDYFERTE